MEEIILSDEQLKTLEKQFGPSVRKMGPWNSDGTFGYICISLAVIENAAESMEDPNVITAFSRLKSLAEPAKPHLELLETFGHAFIEKIVAVYSQSTLEVKPGVPLSRKPPEKECAGGRGWVARVRAIREGRSSGAAFRVGVRSAYPLQ